MPVRILIVEDDVIVANNLHDRLQSLGYDPVDITTTGEEALARAAEARPDLVLMDIKLRGELDGIAAAQAILSHFDIPVVYLTGYADEATLQRAKLSGPYGYVLKPFEVREIRTTIEMALHKHTIERQLRESEHRYRTLVEHSLQGIMIVQGAPPRVVFANSRCADIIGYSQQELLDLPPEDTLALVHPDDRAWLMSRLAVHLARRTVPATDEFRVLRRDGTARWIEYFAGLIELDGKPAVQVTFIDVTERKAAQAALQQAYDELEKRVEARTAELADANERLRAEIDTRTDAERSLQRRTRELELLNHVAHTLGSSLDLDYVLTSLLDGVGHLLDATGCTVWLVQPGADTIVCRKATGPQSEIVSGWRLQPGQGIVGWVLRHGASAIVPDTRLDERHFKDVDRQTGLEIRSLLSVPLKVKQRLIGVIQVADVEPYRFDLADLTLLQPLATSAAVAIENARLYDEANRLRVFSESILQGMQEGILLQGATGHFAFANPSACDLLGYTTGELTRLRWEQIVAPGQAGLAQAAGPGADRSAHLETELLARDGRRLPVLVSARPLSADGGSTGTLFVFTDISERKQAEEALRRRAQELSLLHALSRQVSASLSLQEVVEATLRGLGESLAPDLAMLFLRQGDSLHLLGLHPADAAWQRLAPGAHRVGECLCGLAASQGTPLFSQDLGADPRCAQDECRSAGFRSFAALPLLQGNEVVGVLGLASVQARDFAGRSAFLTALAGHVTIGLQNALLHEELELHAADLEREVADRQRAEEGLRLYAGRMEALYEIDRAILEAHSSEDIARSCLAHIRRLVNCHRASVILFDHEAGQATVLAALAHGDSQLGAGACFPLEEFQIPDGLRRGEVRVVEDVARPPAGGGALSATDRLLLAEGIQAYVTVPLVVQGSLIGALNLGASGPEMLIPEHVEIAREVAGPLAVAIQQARLREQVQQHAAELQEHVGRLERTQAALRESEGRYRLLFERNLAGVYRSTVDGRFLDCNEAFARMLGYRTSQELLSTPVEAIYYELADRPRFIDRLREQRALTNLEWRLRCKDGSTIWCLENASLVEGEAGADEVIQGTIVDITQRKQMESALQVSEERFRSLFDNAPLCIFEVDLAEAPHRLARANRKAQEVYGRSAAELAALTLPQLFAPQSAPDHHWLPGAFATGGALTLESVHRRGDGSTFPVRLSASPLPMANRQRVIVAIEDITAEMNRRSEEEAIAEERRRIAREIHDGLAQNLASMRLRARLWHNILDEDPQRLHAEVEAMRDLLREQIREVRRSIFALRPVALDEVGFFPALEQFVRDFGEQNQLQADLHVLGERGRLPSQLEPVLFRIVQEALNNVGKHARASRIQIALDLRPAGRVDLTIRDDGLGFDLQHLDEAARLGHLGLKQMRERVEELAGDFSLQSWPGQGTELRMALPALDA